MTDIVERLLDEVKMNVEILPGGVVQVRSDVGEKLLGVLLDDMREFRNTDAGQRGITGIYGFIDAYEKERFNG